MISYSRVLPTTTLIYYLYKYISHPIPIPNFIFQFHFSLSFREGSSLPKYGEDYEISRASTSFFFVLQAHRNIIVRQRHCVDTSISIQSKGPCLVITMSRRVNDESHLHFLMIKHISGPCPPLSDYHHTKLRNPSESPV